MYKRVWTMDRSISSQAFPCQYCDGGRRTGQDGGEEDSQDAKENVGRMRGKDERAPAFSSVIVQYLVTSSVMIAAPLLVAWLNTNRISRCAFSCTSHVHARVHISTYACRHLQAEGLVCIVGRGFSKASTAMHDTNA